MASVARKDPVDSDDSSDDEEYHQYKGEYGSMFPPVWQLVASIYVRIVCLMPVIISIIVSKF